MPGLNAFPPGWLSMLGIKSSGKNPGDAGDVLLPTMELRDWYLAQQWQELALSVPNVNAPGFFNFASFGNVWTWLRFTSVRSTGTLAAATTMRVRMGIQQQGSVQWRPFGSILSATTGESSVSVYEPAFLVPPGYRIGVAAEAVTLGTAPSYYLIADSIQLPA